jgi:hypothetical protein
MGNDDLHEALGRLVMMIFHAIFVPDNLTVELVDQFIDCSVQICVRALGKQVATFDMDVALSPLPAVLLLLLLYGKQHFDINHLIKMPVDPVQLGCDITAQSGGNFKVMTTDRQVHK